LAVRVWRGGADGIGRLELEKPLIRTRTTVRESSRRLGEPEAAWFRSAIVVCVEFAEGTQINNYVINSTTNTQHTAFAASLRII